MAPPTGVDAPRGAVVLVEDDRGVATLVAAILEGAGYAVRVCGDGASARRALAAAEPDVLCLDLGLPDVDGRELIGELHQRHRDLPIVVLTADDQIDTVVAAMRAGAYDYLVKPIERDTLIRTVADRLSVALENNRLLEQTQAQARRERQASEIGSVLLSATNVESVLSLAADNFHEALGAIHTRVYLQPGTLIKSGDAN